MNVLMVEDQSPLGAKVASSLRDLGHRVFPCEQSSNVNQDFACRALFGEPCPLDIYPVDAAVGTKSSNAEIITRGNTSHSHPGLDQEGLACAIRRHIPLVMVCDTGDPYGGPFDQWIEAASVHDEVADVVDSIVSSASDSYGAVATKALVSALLIRGLDTTKAKAKIVRKDGRLNVSLEVSGSLDQLTVDGLSVSVHRALREFDPWTGCVDISVSQVQ